MTDFPSPSQSVHKLTLADRLRLAEDRTSSPEILSRLAASGSQEVRHRVAMNPRTDAATLLQLIHDPCYVIRLALVERAVLPPEELHRLSRDRTPLVRRAVAYSGHTPAEVLASMISDRHPDVRHALLENARTPQSAREALADGTDRALEARLAADPRSSPEVLVRIIRNGLAVEEALVAWQRRHRLPAKDLPACLFGCDVIGGLSLSTEVWRQTLRNQMLQLSNDPELFSTLLATWSGTLGDLWQTVAVLAEAPPAGS